MHQFSQKLSSATSTRLLRPNRSQMWLERIRSTFSSFEGIEQLDVAGRSITKFEKYCLFSFINQAVTPSQSTALIFLLVPKFGTKTRGFLWFRGWHVVHNPTFGRCPSDTSTPGFPGPSTTARLHCMLSELHSTRWRQRPSRSGQADATATDSCHSPKLGSHRTNEQKWTQMNHIVYRVYNLHLPNLLIAERKDGHAQVATRNHGPCADPCSPLPLLGSAQSIDTSAKRHRAGSQSSRLQILAVESPQPDVRFGSVPLTSIWGVYLQRLCGKRERCNQSRELRPRSRNMHFVHV